MKKAIKVIIPLLLALAILVCLAWYLFIYDREFTRDMLLYGARYFENQGKHGVASWFYDCAYRQAGDNDAVAIELAEQHKLSGNYTKAENTLSQAIEDGGGTSLYIALCKTYVEQDKLLDAAKLLDNIQNPDVAAELDSLRPAAPTAMPEPGFYSQYISVALQSEEGTLYANQTAEYPSVYDPAYSEPIPLEDGENTIYALSVSDNGLVSRLAVFGYTIGGVVEEVQFTDPAFETQIRTMLEVDEDQVLFTNDLWDITALTVPADASSYLDLAYFPFLEELTITQGPSDDLSVIASLGSLTKLSISQTSIDAKLLSIIGNLPKLETLTLSGCGLSTISGLENAINLTSLDLSNNTIRDISAIASMPQLQLLNASHNAITDLSALSALGQLTSIDVSHNALTSIAPITSITGLSWIGAENNNIANLGDISKLASLNYLNLAFNKLTDVNALSSCTAMNYLDISNNALTDISGLSTLNNLATFNFSYNQVEELPLLSKDCSLVTIDGSHNLLTALDALSGMECLNNVFMDYNPELESVEPLASCHVLIQVNVYGTKVTEVESLTSQSVVVNFDPTQLEE